jgi:ribose 5-phosphate isomerase B
MNLAIGADHAGFELKQIVLQHLQAAGHEVRDFGTYSTDSVDYPDFAHPVATAVAAGEFSRGLLFCGSANGVCITANKHAGIRGAIAWLPELAALARQHNDANVLCVPARYLTEAQGIEIVDTFLATEFEGGRHQNRVSKINC